MYELNIELKYAGLFEKVHLEQATRLPQYRAVLPVPSGRHRCVPHGVESRSHRDHHTLARHGMCDALPIVPTLGCGRPSLLSLVRAFTLGSDSPPRWLLLCVPSGLSPLLLSLSSPPTYPTLGTDGGTVSAGTISEWLRPGGGN